MSWDPNFPDKLASGVQGEKFIASLFERWKYQVIYKAPEYVPAAVIERTGRYRDRGDIKLIDHNGRRIRMEAKRETCSGRRWSCLEDWPFPGRFFVDSVRTYGGKAVKPHLYAFTNPQLDVLALVTAAVLVAAIVAKQICRGDPRLPDPRVYFVKPHKVVWLGDPRKIEWLDLTPYLPEQEWIEVPSVLRQPLREQLEWPW